MRKLTIQEVIKAVPLDEQTKSQILKNYDTYDDAVKFEIMHACWNAYDEMFDAVKKEKYETLMAEVAAGKRDFGDNFLQTVEDAASSEMEEYISGRKYESQALNSIRQQLENLITHTSAKK